MGVVASNKRSQEEIYRSLGLPYSGSSSSGPSGGNQMIDPTPGYVTPRVNKTENPLRVAARAAGATPTAATGTKASQLGITPSIGNVGLKATPGIRTASPYSDDDDYNEGRGYSAGAAPSFSMSDRTQDYYDALDDIEASRPDPFQSRYTAQIDSLLDTIQNPQKFDLNSDETYRQLYDNYKESYMAQGRKAMQDAVGQAAAMTGGYGSSYASQVGQQAYDNYLQQLNDRNIQLYGMALDDYWKNRNDQYNQLNAVSGQDQIDYSRYRDTVGDWQTDRAYYAGQAQTGYGNDWASYQSGLNQYNTEVQRAIDQAQAAQQMAFQQAQADQAQARWEAELQREDAANLLKGMDTRAVIDAWNNPDDPAKQAALQKAIQAAQAVKASSSGGSGGGGRSSGGRRSYGSSGGKKTANDIYGLTKDRFAGQLRMALDNGELPNPNDDDPEENPHVLARRAIYDYVNKRGLSPSAVDEIAKKAGVNMDAGKNQAEDTGDDELPESITRREYEKAIRQIRKDFPDNADEMIREYNDMLERNAIEVR